MKATTKILTLIIACSMEACTQPAIRNNAKITFETVEYDFGELRLNDNGDCNFVFHNPGNTPLVIQHVKSSCGCTIPKWPTNPIKPGKIGEIGVNYDTSHSGVFNKKITVFYNGKNSPKTLTIKGLIKCPDTLSNSETKGTEEI